MLQLSFLDVIQHYLKSFPGSLEKRVCGDMTAKLHYVALLVCFTTVSKWNVREVAQNVCSVLSETTECEYGNFYEKLLVVHIASVRKCEKCSIIRFENNIPPKPYQQCFFFYHDSHFTRLIPELSKLQGQCCTGELQSKFTISKAQLHLELVMWCIHQNVFIYKHYKNVVLRASSNVWLISVKHTFFLYLNGKK